jgi:hypothetical protein
LKQSRWDSNLSFAVGKKETLEAAKNKPLEIKK